MRTRRLLLPALIALVAVSLTACSSLPQTKYDVAADLQDDGLYVKAIPQYRAFIAENKYPTLNAYAQYNIAQCYIKLGRKPEAMAALKEVTVKYPKHEAAKWAAADMKWLADKTLTPVKTKPKAAPSKKAPKKSSTKKGASKK